MQLKNQLLIFLCGLAIPTLAQDDSTFSLNIGDPAPPLQVRAWLKGSPVKSFEKGKIYVVELWATWCKPCVASIPHLNSLVAEYKDKVIAIGIDIYEKKSTSLNKIKAFVDSMGNKMGYRVASGDSSYMVTKWINASGEGETGIPNAFVVDEEGRLAWIGYPKKLNEVLPDIVNNHWSINEALAKRNLNKRLAALDDSARYELMSYINNPEKPGDPGKPDSAIWVIDQIVTKEPDLKYAPFIAYHTFSALIKADPGKAFEYGKIAIVTPTYDNPPYGLIINKILECSDKSRLPTEIYLLGARADQEWIDHLPYPEIVNLSKYYDQMAKFYWLAKDKSKAINSEDKAIEELKGEKGFTKAKLAQFKSRLQQYKKM